MSRFKRDRQAGIGADSPPSVFLQPIAEKTPATVRDTISCSKTGFPSTRQDINLGVTPKNASKPIPEVNFETENMQDYERENLQKVMSMTEQDVQESLATISTMFSATSLDFLRQRGLKELESRKSSASTEHTSTSLPTPAPSASASQQEATPTTSALPPVRPEDVIATSLEELQKRQLEAPPEVQARLAWTLDVPDSTTDEDERAKQRQFAADERFDLYGNKIISSQILFPQITKMVFPTNSAATETIQHLLSLCVDNSGLARDQNTYATLENQPQNELRHHESDMHRIGYTIREACEVSHTFEYLYHMNICSYFVRRSHLSELLVSASSTVPYSADNLSSILRPTPRQTSCIRPILIAAFAKPSPVLSLRMSRLVC